MIRILLFLLISFPFITFGQSDSAFRYFQAGISPLSYKGDLSHSYRYWGQGFHFGFELKSQKRVSPAFNIMFGSVSASNSFYEAVDTSPNTFFKTRLLSFEFDLKIKLIRRKYFNFYLSPGAGLLHFSPRNEEMERLQDYPTKRAPGEDYSNISFILPLQAGLAFYLPQGPGIGLQAGWINPFTDYIDNISEWGNHEKKDNILLYKIFLAIPLNDVSE